MNWSSSGRLPRKPFVIGVLVVYLASFLSQSLLGEPFILTAGLWPFTIAQLVLIWAWYVLHVRRLRDAGRSTGIALGIASIYTLMIVLLILVMAVLTASSTSNESLKAGQSMMQLFAIVFFFAALFGDAGSMGAIGYWIAGLLLLTMLPIFVGLGFSLWTATRPSIPAPT